jgi:signal transduction histidine kinase
VFYAHRVLGFIIRPGVLPDGMSRRWGALTIHLNLLEEPAGDSAAVRELVAAVKNGVRAALDDLRDLARGIYPPLLAGQGLVPALQAQARKACLPVQIDADGIVTDNGTGFDTATTRYGTGLQGMTDRLAALGGALRVRSQPGHGTMLSGELPLPYLVTD